MAGPISLWLLLTEGTGTLAETPRVAPFTPLTAVWLAGPGSLTVENCTFYTNCATGGKGGRGGNAAPEGLSVRGVGGIGGPGGSGSGGAFYWTLGCGFPGCGPTSCTFYHNAAVAGQGGSGGLGAPNGLDGSPGTSSGGGLSWPGEQHFRNNIIAGNSAAVGPDICAGAAVSEGYNLVGNQSGVTWEAAIGDKLLTPPAVLDPRLQWPLAENGGPTPTLALLPDSPAIDQGYSFGVTIDQRGFGRPYDYPDVLYPNAPGGDGSDMGAFEKQPRSTLSSTYHQVLAPGYSLLAMPLDATDNRVSALFAALTQPGFSVFKIDGNGIRASSFLNGQWSDPDLTLSPGEAWFFKNPYSSGFVVDISGFIPTGTLIKSLPPGISACSSVAEVGGGVHTALLFPVPLGRDLNGMCVCGTALGMTVLPAGWFLDSERTTNCYRPVVYDPHLR